MNNLHQELIETIRRHTPAGMHPVDFLLQIIPMKKEAAYRRLRGEILFSLDESYQIAKYLDISLDDIFGLHKENIFSISMFRMKNDDPISTYCRTLEGSVKTLKYMKTCPEAKILTAANRLPLSLLYKYPTISKLRLYKWIYQRRDSAVPPKFSEVYFPPAVRQLEETYHFESQHISTQYVWMKELFASYISDLEYFKETGLVTKDEYQLLKEESFSLLNELYRDTSNGETQYGAPFIVYVSNTYFDSGYIYIESPQVKACSLNVFGINFYTSLNPDICDDMKKWIESLRRFSTLISKSGEAERIKFFRLQEAIINTPT